MAALGERYNTCSQRCTSNPSPPWLLAGTSISLLASCISLQLSIPPITACSGAWKHNSVLTLLGSETSQAPVGSHFGSDCCYLRPFLLSPKPNIPTIFCISPFHMSCAPGKQPPWVSMHLAFPQALPSAWNACPLISPHFSPKAWS